MRIIITCLCFLFGYTSLSAQIIVEPLESNPVLKRYTADAEATRIQRFERFYGVEETATRALDCDNADGVYFSGETIYLVAGDSVELCFLTTDLDTVYDVSMDLTFGTTTLDTTGLTQDCVKYVSNQGTELGLTDTIFVDKCDSLGCLEFFYPVVVKRADAIINIPTIELAQEEEIQIYTPALDLPGDIYATSVGGCGGSTILGEVFNVVFSDSSFVYVASRFAEPDEICFEVCDEYCICDTYVYNFTTTINSIDYPFIDDFSYSGPRPDRLSWLDDDVFINTTMAYQPPSVGVASFDGLDKTGSPHGTGIGRADFLTSNYFNLSAADNDLWLSFWLENKGLSYASNPGDNFTVEFKNDMNEWIEVFTVDGFDYTLADRPPFVFYKIPLDDGNNNFLFNGFQFRFVNVATRSNMQDSWHLDYVVLDQTEPDSTFEDLAFTNLPNDMLERYSSMPWWQFEDFAEEELGDTTFATIKNHFTSQFQPQNSEVRHKGIQSGVSTSILDFFTLVEPAETMIQPGERFETARDIPSVTELADALVAAYGGTDDKLSIERKYTYVVSPSQVNFESVERNDTVTLNTVFDNYYAYDDGTAEAAVRVNLGHEVAVRFNTNIDDSLRAVQFHFPRIGPQSSSALFNLKVYIGELDDEPEYQRNLIKPFFIDTAYDTLQGFTTYRLLNGDILDPLFIPAGDFYVAWEQASSNESRVYVGYDFNTGDAQPHQFFNNNIDWFSIGDSAAVMIRPVLGNITPGETPVQERSVLADWMKIFPNPASNQIQFELKQGRPVDYNVQLLTATGQLVYNESLTNTVDISSLPQGMYFVKVTQVDTNTVLTQRLVVVK